MFTLLQEFVQAVVGNSMLLMVVLAIPVAAGALVFYGLAREPVRPELGGWLGSLTRRGRRPVHRVHRRKVAGAADLNHSPETPADIARVGAASSVPAGHVTFIDPFQDEDVEEMYELDDIDPDLEADDGLDTLSA